MKTPFKQWLIALVGLMSVATGAPGQDYPNKPVKLIVGYAPGGGPDVAARVLGQQLSKILGQAFVVETKLGAGGTLAAAQVARSPADGYTLMVGETGQLSIAPYLFKGLSYDTIKDFTPVALVAAVPLVFVSNARTTRIKTIQDLVREAKANPGKFHYGSSGIGTLHHLTMEVFKTDAGVDLTHVSYKGSGQSVPALLGGEVPVLVTALMVVWPHVRAGTVNLLAVTTAARSADIPDVQSLSEVIKDYDYSAEVGVLAPAGLPSEALTRLSKAIRAALDAPELQHKFKEVGLTPAWATPEGYADNLRRNLKKYERAVRVANVQPN